MKGWYNGGEKPPHRGGTLAQQPHCREACKARRHTFPWSMEPIYFVQLRTLSPTNSVVVSLRALSYAPGHDTFRSVEHSRGPC